MPAIEPSHFFAEKRSFPEIKKEIFGNYFDNWCHTQVTKLKEGKASDVLFIDLQAGAEHHDLASTAYPLMPGNCLYKSIVKRQLLNEAMRSFYFIKSKDSPVLEDGNILEQPCFGELNHTPVSLNNQDGKTQMKELLESGCSSLVFMDPFENSFAQQLLLQSVNVWRSEVFMLLRPDNLTKALAGKKKSQSVSEFFGDHLSNINSYFRKEKDSFKRQRFVLDHFITILKDKGYFSVLFKVNLPDTESAEHYILFSSPDNDAYRRFKEVVLPYSIFQEDGVPLFAANTFPKPQFTLFEEPAAYTLAKLAARISCQAGNYKYKSIETIFELDSLNTNYCRDNYLAAVEQLRKAGKVELMNSKTMQTIRQPTFSSIVKYK